MNTKDTIRESTELALNVTPSVLALANVLGVAPDKLAAALVDDNSAFLAALTAEITKVMIAKEKEREAKNNLKDLIKRAK